MGRILWRALKAGVPNERDFWSQKALGLRCRDEAMRREWATGISVYDSPTVLGQMIAQYPAIGTCMVALDVPEDGSVAFAQTGANAHHYTIYEPPERTMPLMVEGSITKAGGTT